jgi:hypothetical protein
MKTAYLATFLTGAIFFAFLLRKGGVSLKLLNPLLQIFLLLLLGHEPDT